MNHQREPPTLDALWSAALAIERAQGGEPFVSVLAIVRAEYPANVRTYLAREIEGTKGSPCGADEVCEGVDVSDRVAKRAAYGALLAALAPSVSP